MELQQLRGFCEVARQGSFTRAADKLFLTQPAVSQQVRSLEEELGQSLLERGRKGVRLTHAGEALFRRARSVLGELAAARAELEEMGTHVRGRVLMATSDTNCTYVLPPVLRRFRERFPEVDVDIRNKMSSEIGQLVLADEIDFGLATLPIRDRGLSTEPVFERSDVWICPPGHPLSGRQAVLPATAGRHPLLALERGSQSRSLLDWPSSAAARAALSSTPSCAAPVRPRPSPWSWAASRSSNASWRSASASPSCRGSRWPPRWRRGAWPRSPPGACPGAR